MTQGGQRALDTVLRPLSTCTRTLCKLVVEGIASNQIGASAQLLGCWSCSRDGSSFRVRPVWESMGPFDRCRDVTCSGGLVDGNACVNLTATFVLQLTASIERRSNYTAIVAFGSVLDGPDSDQLLLGCQQTLGCVASCFEVHSFEARDMADISYAWPQL